MVGKSINGKLLCPKCSRNLETDHAIDEYEERDQLTTCDKCKRLIVVPLSKAGVATLTNELLNQLISDTVTDYDREAWSHYGHLVMCQIRDKFSYPERRF